MTPSQPNINADEFQCASVAALTPNFTVRHDNQATSVTTGLFALPQEIRDLIYHELWKPTSLRLTLQPRPGKISYTLSYSAGWTDTNTGLPLWLLVNKAMLQEGLYQLFRHATRVLGVFRDYTLNRYARHNMLVGLSAATNLTIRDTYRVHGISEGPGPYGITIEYANHPVQSILPLLSSRMRALTLNLTIVSAASRALSMDLSSLRRNGLQLDKLAILIRLDLWSDTAQGCVERYTTFLDRTKAEVLQLGATWVGENPKMRFQEEIDSRVILPGMIRMGPVIGIINQYNMAFEVVRMEDSM
jgi:hypothetical protein